MSLLLYSPTRVRWWLTAINETPEFTVTRRESLVRTNSWIEAPIFLSTGGTVARKLTVTEEGELLIQAADRAAAFVTQAELVTPAGASWVLGLGDDGQIYIDTWTGWRSRMPLMHRRKLVWSADNRFPPPTEQVA